MTRFGYGITVRSLYNPRDPEHFKRSSLARKNSTDGKTYIHGQFQVILPKVCIYLLRSINSILSIPIQQHTAVSEEEEFRSRFGIDFDTIFQFEQTTCKIGCYKGLREEQMLWQDSDPGKQFPRSMSGLTWSRR